MSRGSVKGITTATGASATPGVGVEASGAPWSQLERNTRRPASLVCFRQQQSFPPGQLIQWQRRLCSASSSAGEWVCVAATGAETAIGLRKKLPQNPTAVVQSIVKRTTHDVAKLARRSSTGGSIPQTRANFHKLLIPCQGQAQHSDQERAPVSSPRVQGGKIGA
jgi:hypothetical protein